VTRLTWRDLPLKSLALAAAALAVAAPAAASLLEYDRSAILRGELWRIVTAHLVHCSPHHILWNVLPLIGVGILFEKALGRRFWPVLFVSCVAVGGGLLLFEPGLATYRGLSGVLNGLWVAGALYAAGHEKRAGRGSLALLYRGCLLLDLGKIALEAATGTPIFTDPSALGGEPIALAHLLGAAAGLCAALPAEGMFFRASPQPSSI
jgi:rhomboid family GlyGly-CTERM serine protease